LLQTTRVDNPVTIFHSTKIQLWRNGHEFVTFTPESKKSPEYDERPHQGLSEAQRGKKVFFNFLVINPPRGVPSGAGAFIVPE
jgi:hypothetical protein